MSPAERIRATTPDDAAALRQFRCSTGAWYEDDVEAYVRGPLATRVGNGFGALVAERGGELLAVVAHEAAVHPNDPNSTITFINVLAGRVDDREHWLTGAMRMSRMLRAVFTAVASTDRAPWCYARVAGDNVAMRRLCERTGFVGVPVPSDRRYYFYVVLIPRPARGRRRFGSRPPP